MGRSALSFVAFIALSALTIAIAISLPKAQESESQGVMLKLEYAEGDIVTTYLEALAIHQEETYRNGQGQGTRSLHSRDFRIDECQIEAVENGKPTQALSTYIRAGSAVLMSNQSERNSRHYREEPTAPRPEVENQTSTFQGTQVRYSLEDGEWSGKVVRNPNDATLDYRLNAVPLTSDFRIPDRRVKVGESWPIETTPFRDYMAGADDYKIIDIQGNMRLESVEDNVATIAYSVNFRCQPIDPKDGSELDIGKMVLPFCRIWGTLTFDVKRGQRMQESSRWVMRRENPKNSRDMREVVFRRTKDTVLFFRLPGAEVEKLIAAESKP